jgi:hypothetical protein
MLLLRRSSVLTVLLAAAVLAGPAQAQGTKAGSVTKTSGDVSATLSWRASSDIVAQGGHITISRGGTQVLDTDLKKICRLCEYLGAPKSALAIHDLDGDGEPEILVDTFTGGAHCCSTGVIFWSDGTTYQHNVHFYGDSDYQLKDYNGDGNPEFLTDDDRFAYVFSAYAFSYRPVMLLDWQGHKLVDVTNSFPSQIGVDVHFIDRGIAEQVSTGGDARGLIAARCADMARLGLAAKIPAYLDRALKKGWLNGMKGWPRGRKYKPALLKFLEKTGYIS